MRKVILLIIALSFSAAAQTHYGGGAGQTVWYGSADAPPPPPPAPGENALCRPGTGVEKTQGTPTWGTADHIASLDTNCMHTALSSTPTGTHPDASPGNTFVPTTAATLLNVLASSGTSSITAVTLAGNTGGLLHLNCGDTIQLTAGSTYVGPFTFPNITCDGGHWIYTVSSGVTDPAFPAEGVQATPCVSGIANDATNGRGLPGYPDYVCPSYPTVLTAQLRTGNVGSGGAIQFASGANHYRFIGIEVTKNPANNVAALISLANDNLTAGAHHIIFDRSPIHGVTWTTSATANDATGNGIDAKGSQWVAEVNSWNYDTYCIGACVDSHGFSAGTSIIQDGPLKLYGNLIASSGENFFTGGGGVGAGMPNTQGFEIRSNLFLKPLTWMIPIESCPLYQNVIPKNLGEFKNTVNALIEGNFFQNSWQGCQSDQNGVGFVTNPSNQNKNLGMQVNFDGTNVVVRADSNSFTHNNGVPNDPDNCPVGGCVLEIDDASNRTGIDQGANYIFCNGTNGCNQAGLPNLQCGVGSNTGASCSTDSDCGGSTIVGRCAPTTHARMTSTVPSGTAIGVQACVPGGCPACLVSNIVLRFNEFYNMVQGISVHSGPASHCHDEARGLSNVVVGDNLLRGISREMSNGVDPTSDAEGITVTSGNKSAIVHDVEIYHNTVAVETGNPVGFGSCGQQADRTNLHYLKGLNIHDNVCNSAWHVSQGSGSLLVKGVNGLAGLSNVYQTDACQAYYPVEAPAGIVLAGNLTNFTFSGFNAVSYMVTLNGAYRAIAAPPANWSGGTSYASGAKATFSGIVYFSLQNSNLNHQPTTSPTWWRPGFTLSVAAGAGNTITVRNLQDCDWRWAGNILGGTLADPLDGMGKPNDPYPAQNSCGVTGTASCILGGTVFTGLFANFGTGRVGDYTITSASYLNSATDADIRTATGKNPGADITNVLARTSALSPSIFYPTLSITSGTLTPGFVGTPYTAPLAASTGASPFKAWFQETTAGNCGGDCGTLPPGIVISRGGTVNGPLTIQTVAITNNRAKITINQAIVAPTSIGWVTGQRVLLASFCIDVANPCTAGQALDADFNGSWIVAASNSDCTNTVNIVCLILTHANIASHAPNVKGTNDPVATFAPTTVGTFSWWMGARDGAFQVARAQITLVVNAVYALPNDDTNCPANCRVIPWQAGSDVWNSGTLPTYTQNTCGGLAGNGTTNDGPAIQACINAASANTAVFIPAGVYLVNTNVALKSNVSLRGAKASGKPFLPTADASATTLKLGASGAVSFGSGSMGANTAIASGYTKGSTSITMNAGHGFVANDWIIVAQRADTGIGATATGDDGNCTWCGENDGVNIMAQIVQATNVSGNVITLSRPLYYTFQSGFSPVARKVTFSVSKAGLENMRLDGSNADHGAFISISNTAFPWVKGVETYEAGTAAKAAHVFLNFSYGFEIRDNYFHHGRDSSSDRNYGVFLFQVNTDGKVENNILRNNRHGIVSEAGGSGNAILYNYIDDQYTSDVGFLGSSRSNHGAHPYMNLYEGNIFSSLAADSIWGSSSHNVFFRNHIWGDETLASDVPVQPTFGFTPVLNVSRNQNYYAFVGNVIGISGKWGSPNWASFGVRNTNCATFATSIYGYGCDSNNVFSATAGSTSINHGNWDIKTNGVAYWEGGSIHALAASTYYVGKPTFFGSSVWPPFGPEGNPTVNSIPAKGRFDAP